MKSNLVIFLECNDTYSFTILTVKYYVSIFVLIKCGGEMDFFK